jgi:hypothetical protein
MILDWRRKSAGTWMAMETRFPGSSASGFDGSENGTVDAMLTLLAMRAIASAQTKFGGSVPQ